MSANNNQVGGDHYKAEYQHWDWVLDMDLTYYEGCATKYIARCWKKNGIQDLEKAGHYLVKYCELIEEGKVFPRQRNIALLPDICAAWGLDEFQARLIEGAVCGSLPRIRQQVLRDLRLYTEANRPQPKYKPPVEHPAPFGYDGEGI